ncbi:GGDEF domain-containing protein, partial [Blautia pseudococcoides]|nr:GGDEF domain-containing protein [Blautia pseudococcoides]
VVRMGGDEFAVFLQGNVDFEMAEKKAALVLEAIRDIQIQGAGSLVSASIGIAISPRDGRTFSQLYRAADTAMYRVKKSDKDGFCISR